MSKVGDQSFDRPLDPQLVWVPGPIHSCQQKYRPKALFSWGKASPRALNPKSSRATWKASYLRCDSFPLHPFTSAEHPDLFCQNIIKIYVHLSI